MYNAGIPIHLKGTEYLCHAVIMRMQGTEKLSAIYFNIAKQNNTTEAGVERNMRHCIASAWCRERERFCEVFGERCMERRPTNKEFIYAVAYKIKIKLI